MEKYRNPHRQLKENLFLPLFNMNFISKTFGGPLHNSFAMTRGKARDIWRVFLVTNLRKLKKIQISIHGNYDKDWRLEIKICHFWEFHKSRWINKRHKSRVTRIKKIRRQRKLGLPQSQIMKKKWLKREKKCVAVKRGVRVRRNCNAFNLGMENVLKGLPDKIRDQLSRHHTQMHFKCTHF